MPIEVRELVIRVRVEDQAPSASNTKATGERQVVSEKELQNIIAMCTEQMLKILEQQKEK